ncbi:MAG: GGDEF domain protein [Candidatus Scalindua rubra]|uniref:diguanylate cyclase n=1 Tax=Candidatus Scalindua rubra TaxID=1872076 RepID=A0A1E3XCR0_9BACT|nr:MAG: GGDEF domain protein [Candidatus Scalindua rubra]
MLKSVSNLEELTDLIVQASSDRVNAEKCSIMLLDENRQTLAVNKAKGFNGNQSEIKSTKVKLGEGIAGLVALKGESLLVTDVSKRKNYQSKYSIRYNSNSFISMPLKVKSDTIGVLNLTDKIDNHQFTERDLHSLSTFTSCASIAIKNALMFEELQNLSLTDELTGLYNRRHFYKCLENEMIRSGRFDRHFTLAILDIDNFKYYNDTYGHLAGDSILKQVSEILKTQTRGIDIVARYGGEEFAVIFPETQGTKNSITSTSSGLQFPERLRAAFESHSFLNISTGKKLNLTISGGVAIFPLDGKTTKDLISRADENLYHAKRNGRNKVYVGRIYPSKSDNSTQKNTTISRNSIQKLAARLTARKALSG